jgi:hypothetical protein
MPADTAAAPNYQGMDRESARVVRSEGFQPFRLVTGEFAFLNQSGDIENDLDVRLHLSTLASKRIMRG